MVPTNQRERVEAGTSAGMTTMDGDFFLTTERPRGMSTLIRKETRHSDFRRTNERERCALRSSDTSIPLESRTPFHTPPSIARYDRSIPFEPTTLNSQPQTFTTKGPPPSPAQPHPTTRHNPIRSISVREPRIASSSSLIQALPPYPTPNIAPLRKFRSSPFQFMYIRFNSDLLPTMT